MTLLLMVGNLCWLYVEHEFESSCWISCLYRSFNSIQNLKLLSRNHLKNVTLKYESEFEITNFSGLKWGMYNTV